MVFGYSGPIPVPSTWLFIRLHEDAVSRPIGKFFVNHLAKVFRVLGLLLARFGLVPALRLFGAKVNHWAVPIYRRNRKAILRHCAKGHEHYPDLVLCHDYFTVDVALAVGHKFAVPVSVDCHEYALGQHPENGRWMNWYRPVVKLLQDDWFCRVDGVTTVCSGIAQQIMEEHELRRPVSVVRSVPFFAPMQYRPTGDIITVLYHGEIFPTRALHIAVRSIRLWRPEFRLVLRGYSDPAYVDRLLQIAEETGVSDRLTIEPPVVFNQIIPTANLADIGYFVHLDSGLQRRFALPNKFFEYVMAGLALVVSDLPEMAYHIREHKLGELVPRCDEESIATVINSFDRDKINRLKLNSLYAANELCWDQERERMLSLYEKFLP